MNPRRTTLLATVWMMAFATTVAAEPLLTNTTSFRIPFTVESTPGPSTDGYAVLFGARDGGRMQQLQRVPVRDREFQFSAPSDGTWQFAIRMTDSAGRPDDTTGPLSPELEVIVDTIAPGLMLNLSDAGQGNVHVTWQATEEFVLASLNLQYAEGNDGRWKSLSVPLSASGETTIQSRPGTSVAVRAQLTDRAGNTGSVTREVILANAAPAPSIPASPPHGGNRWNSLPGTSAPAIGTPVGPSPFPQVPSSGSQQATPFGAGGFPQASAVPQLPSPTPAPSTSSMTSQPLAASPVAATSGSPVTQPWQMAGQQAVIAGTAHHPMGGQAAPQLVSGHVFNVAYAVEDVGPSGVSSVELFVTEDNGRQWFRYGNDTDLQSPMQVDVQGEGTFGFAIRVRNGVGFIDPPPQPGDLPEIVVTVDRTPPTVEMQMPQVHVDGSASVRVGWNVLEAQPADVRLEWAAAPSGPWVPVFDWQQDQGRYNWPVSANMPQSMYFRLLARDAAGNIGSAQTAQPVLIDLKRPKARMLGVQAASQNIGY